MARETVNGEPKNMQILCVNTGDVKQGGLARCQEAASGVRDLLTEM